MITGVTKYITMKLETKKNTSTEKI
jgi:hypothetical protein